MFSNYHFPIKKNNQASAQKKLYLLHMTGFSVLSRDKRCSPTHLLCALKPSALSRKNRRKLPRGPKWGDWASRMSGVRQTGLGLSSFFSFSLVLLVASVATRISTASLHAGVVERTGPLVAVDQPQPLWLSVPSHIDQSLDAGSEHGLSEQNVLGAWEHFPPD